MYRILFSTNSNQEVAVSSQRITETLWEMFSPSKREPKKKNASLYKSYNKQMTNKKNE